MNRLEIALKKRYGELIRWYKGKRLCMILIKSRMNYRVGFFDNGEEFTTVPRLLWRHPKGET